MVTRHREPRLDDLPVWRALELAPNPANIKFHRTYLPVLLGLTIRLAQLQHPPIHNYPLWSETLAAQETHHGQWEAICQQISSTQPDAEEQQFRALFHNAHQRQPTEADVPTWQSLVLTETITVQRPLTRAEYTAAARLKMLRPITGRSNLTTLPPTPSLAPLKCSPQHALAIMFSCDPPPAIKVFLQEFLVTSHREPRLDDLVPLNLDQTQLTSTSITRTFRPYWA